MSCIVILMSSLNGFHSHLLPFDRLWDVFFLIFLNALLRSGKNLTLPVAPSKKPFPRRQHFRKSNVAQCHERPESLLKLPSLSSRPLPPSKKKNIRPPQLNKPCGQSRSQSMPVRGLCSGMTLHNPRTGILWERDCLVVVYSKAVPS
jgi:hypothetical protein